MKIKLSPEKIAALRTFLDAHEDAELLSEKGGRREYVADFFDREVPVSIDVILGKDALFVDGAAYMHYDEELDGWYIAENIDSAETVLDILTQAGALPQ